MSSPIPIIDPANAFGMRNPLSAPSPIGTLESRTQSPVEEVLKTLVTQNPAWQSASSTFWDAIMSGFESIADFVRHLLQQVFGVGGGDDPISAFIGQLTNLDEVASEAWNKVAEAISMILGIANSLTGFLRGDGAAAGGTILDPIVDWVKDALGLFTSQTNVVATTADVANGVGGNALTNTVAIQTQVQGLKDRQDQGWSARPLWASMDFTADATFPKRQMVSIAAHSHSVSGNTDSSLGIHSHSFSFSDTTDTASAGGTSHSHGYSDSGTTGGVSLSHIHAFSATSGASGAVSITPAVVNASTAFFGYIRCGSVQEKRMFTFLAQGSGTVSTFNLDVYRMAADGALTLVYSSANIAGAITGTLGWVQHVIPAGTASVNVAPEDVLAIQLRMTGAGSVALGGIVDPLPVNPPGYYPLRESAVRNPSGTPAPSTIAAGTANGQHTSTAIPYIEAGVDTGLASAPLSLSDNFNGSLSQFWLMTGVNTLDATSNTFGITEGGSDGWSWGKFNTQLRTDQARVGFTTTSPNAEEQVLWFKGNGSGSHVGLAVTSSYATIYTMSGGARTNRAQVAIGTVGATYVLSYNAATKVFAVTRNGSQILTWTDSGNVAPTGLGNRFGGIGLHATRSGWFGLTYTQGSPIDDWLLADI